MGLLQLLNWLLMQLLRGSEPGEATGVGSSECTGAEKGSWNWKNPADIDSCTAGWPLTFHR